MYSSKDFESLWFLYQAEGLPKNISIEELTFPEDLIECRILSRRSRDKVNFSLHLLLENVTECRIFSRLSKENASIYLHSLLENLEVSGNYTIFANAYY